MVALQNFVTHTLHGVQYGFILFLIASGLTIILGILDVLTSPTANCSPSARTSRSAYWDT